MQRILDPAQIEAFTERSIPRVRLCDPASMFAVRARRLRALAEKHALGDYLRLMAAVADAQQVALGEMLTGTPTAGGTRVAAGTLAADGAHGAAASGGAREVAGSSASHADRFALAHAHGMPLLPAAGGPRERRWRSVLNEICSSVAGASGFPPGVRAVCERILALDDAAADAQADLLLAERASGADAQAAPFIMAALQVYWAASTASLQANDVTQIDVPGVCPVCGTLPVSSIVRSDKRSQGYRYLHCALCATEWHMVRIVCSHCQANEGIAYHTIEGGSDAIRAESCGKCHTYRKILYQEKDPEVEPVADDLASVALDLLMSEEGFHRGSGNPLLWQNADA